MRAIVAVVLLQTIAGTASASDTLATPAAPATPAVVSDSVAKAVASKLDSAVAAPVPPTPTPAVSVRSNPVPPRLGLPMEGMECPRMAMRPMDCCGGMEPGWGIGARVLGSTSELLFHFPVSPRAEIAVRTGWSSTTTSENDPWVDSRYVSTEVTTAGDTFVTHQNLTGSGHLEATNNTARLAIQVLGDFPRGKGVSLLVGGGPRVSWGWADSTNATDGLSKDTVPLHLISTSTNWSIAAGLLATLGARWWFVPGRLALVAELEAGVDWSYTSQVSSQTTVRRVEYQNPVGVNYYELQATNTGSDTRSNWWTISTSTATCSIGIDAFF